MKIRVGFLRPPTPPQIPGQMEVQVMMPGHMGGVPSIPHLHPQLPVARIDREGCPLSRPSPQRLSALVPELPLLCPCPCLF